MKRDPKELWEDISSCLRFSERSGNASQNFDTFYTVFGIGGTVHYQLRHQSRRLQSLEIIVYLLKNIRISVTVLYLCIYSTVSLLSFA